MPRLVVVLIVAVILGGESCGRAASTGTASDARQASAAREATPLPNHPLLPPQTADWSTYSSADYGYSLSYSPRWFDLGGFGSPSMHYFSNNSNASSPLNMGQDDVFIGVFADCEWSIGSTTLISQANVVVDTFRTTRYVISSSGPDGVIFAAVATIKPRAFCYRISMLGWTQKAIESNLGDFDLMLETIRFSTRTAPIAGTPSAFLPPTSPATCPSPSPSPDPTTGWILLSNKTGQFSLSYPCDWGSANCDGYAALGPEFNGSGMSFCGTDEGIPTVLIVEFPSTTPQGQQAGEYVGDITGSAPVTADGVTGTRQTAAVTANLPLPPAKGATQVVYRFMTDGRSYVLYYTREPGQPDLTSGVDTIVERTLRFTA